MRGGLASVRLVFAVWCRVRRYPGFTLALGLALILVGSWALSEQHTQPTPPGDPNLYSVQTPWELVFGIVTSVCGVGALILSAAAFVRDRRARRGREGEDFRNPGGYL